VRRIKGAATDPATRTTNVTSDFGNDFCVALSADFTGCRLWTESPYFSCCETHASHAGALSAPPDALPADTPGVFCHHEFPYRGNSF
jgi:hypothetical protein